MRALRVVIAGFLSWTCGGSSADGETVPDANSNDQEVDVAEVAEVFVQSALCPATLIQEPLVRPLCRPGASEGLECRYAPPGCEPGIKPDNVCHCGADGILRCEGHLRNCLPFSSVDSRRVITNASRPMPRHHPAGTTCPQPDPADSECTPVWWSFGSINGGPSECGKRSECEDSELCLQVDSFARATQCLCRELECLSDADCEDDTLCDCGITDPALTCGTQDAQCSHRCVPAWCRTDADCGVGGWCSPSFDDCHASLLYFACHRAESDECTSDAECFYSRDGRMCQFSPGAGWRCRQEPVCE